jgi:predicted Zn-ribbon and HTH transcriptional regulator
MQLDATCVCDRWARRTNNTAMMNRPPLEVADIVRSRRESFEEQSRGWINWQHRKVLDAIVRSRTAALGGHRDRCADCGHVAISYDSCGNRHCPKCQGNARLRRLDARGSGPVDAGDNTKQDLSTLELRSTDACRASILTKKVLNACGILGNLWKRRSLMAQVVARFPLAQSTIIHSAFLILNPFSTATKQHNSLSHSSQDPTEVG